MPTFNQLGRKGRTMAAYKSTSPTLQHGLNTLKNRSTDLPSPDDQDLLDRLSQLTGQLRSGFDARA